MRMRIIIIQAKDNCKPTHEVYENLMTSLKNNSKQETKIMLS